MFTNLFPVVGSYIWIFIVIITMASKHISSALIPTKNQNKTVSSLLSSLLRNTSVKVPQHVPGIKNRTLFRRQTQFQILFFHQNKQGPKSIIKVGVIDLRPDLWL